MDAMTWWDHETSSIWSQPWGRAIEGELEGVELTLLPAGIMPWAAWLADHPDTLVLLGDDRAFFDTRQPFTDQFALGVTLGEHAKAYPFELASKEQVINDWMGPFPLVVLVDTKTKAPHIYLRVAGPRDLEFKIEDGVLVDLQTGSTWDSSKGIALSGPLQGTLLQQVPYVSSFEWAWEDFYPHSEFYELSRG